MIHLITELSKYVMIILFAIYTWIQLCGIGSQK